MLGPGDGAWVWPPLLTGSLGTAEGGLWREQLVSPPVCGTEQGDLGCSLVLASI